MSNRQKVTITIDESILKDIDRLSEKEGKNRSRLIEKAVKVWRQKRVGKGTHQRLCCYDRGGFRNCRS